MAVPGELTAVKSGDFALSTITNQFASVNALANLVYSFACLSMARETWPVQYGGKRIS